jgi:hypothetical protein
MLLHVYSSSSIYYINHIRSCASHCLSIGANKVLTVNELNVSKGCDYAECAEDDPLRSMVLTHVAKIGHVSNFPASKPSKEEQKSQLPSPLPYKRKNLLQSRS